MIQIAVARYIQSMISVMGSIRSDKKGGSGRFSNELELIPNPVGNHYGSSLLPWVQRQRTQNILLVPRCHLPEIIAASGHIKLYI